MPANQQLTITLPKDVVEMVRSKVSSGEFASESDVIQESLINSFDTSPELENWLQTIGAERYDAYDANPGSTYSSDQIIQTLSERLTARKTG